VAPAVGEVDDETERHPDDETQPRHSDQIEHEVEAEDGRQGRDDRCRGHPEGARQVGTPAPQQHDPDADQDEREERADVDKVGQLRQVDEAGDESDRSGGDQRDPLGSPVLRVHPGESPWQHTVARHGEGDAGLSEHQDHTHDGETDTGTEGHDVADPRHPDGGERGRERCAVIWVDGAVALHAGDDQAHCLNNDIGGHPHATQRDWRSCCRAFPRRDSRAAKRCCVGGVDSVAARRRSSSSACSSLSTHRSWHQSSGMIRRGDPICTAVDPSRRPE